MRTLVVLLSFPAIGFADVIDDSYEPPTCPEMTCAPGSSSFTGGHGSCPVGCVPTYLECTSDAQCSTDFVVGSTCVETRFCVEERFAGRSGNVDVVIGTPNADGTCATGRPSISRRCTQPPPQPVTANEEEESGCSASGSNSSWLALALLFAWRPRR